MRYLSLLLITLGLTISGYLLFRHIVLTDLSAQTGADFCSALFGRGCDDALRSPLAIQLGLPLAGWGLVYYGALVSLLLLAWTMGEGFRAEAITGALVLALGAAAGSIALFVVMSTDLSPFCPMCATVHAINVLLLFPLKRMSGRSIGQLVGAVGRAARYIVGDKADDPVAARWHCVGFLVPGLVAVVIYQWVYVDFALRTHSAEMPFDPVQMVTQFESGLQQEILITDADPQLGPKDAPVRMVVFNDFQCPGCRQLAQTVHGLSRKFEGSLHIVFKHFPLDSVCNSLVKRELHPKACEAARMAEAAHAQGKFWAFHEALFMPRSREKMTMKTLVEHLELNVEQFEAYRKGDPALAKVKADIDLGMRLGVDGTPSVFLNGRRVYDTRVQALQLLIIHEMEHAGHVHGND
ncbi:vitamin K epoxide reductase family protein [Planctomycetota bacterium]